MGKDGSGILPSRHERGRGGLPVAPGVPVPRVTLKSGRDGTQWVLWDPSATSGSRDARNSDGKILGQNTVVVQLKVPIDVSFCTHSFLFLSTSILEVDSDAGRIRGPGSDSRSSPL